MSTILGILFLIIVFLYVRRGKQTPSQKRSYSNISSKSNTTPVRFRHSRTIGGVQVDDHNQSFKFKKFNQHPLKFEDVIKYEIHEDGQTIMSGGLSIGRAIVGGALIGGIGAVMGGVTGKKKGRDVATNVEVLVTMRGEHSGLHRISLLNSKTKRSSNKYRIAIQNAQEVIALFDIKLDELGSR